MKANGIKGDVSSDYSVSAPLQHRNASVNFLHHRESRYLWPIGCYQVVRRESLTRLGTGALAEACLSRNPDLQVTGYEKTATS